MIINISINTETGEVLTTKGVKNAPRPSVFGDYLSPDDIPEYIGCKSYGYCPKCKIIFTGGCLCLADCKLCGRQLTNNIPDGIHEVRLSGEKEAFNFQEYKGGKWIRSLELK